MTTLKHEPSNEEVNADVTYSKEESLTIELAKERAENEDLRKGIELLKKAYEEKIKDVETQMNYGLEDGKDPKENIRLAVKLIKDRKVDIAIPKREFIARDVSRLKLDTNIPRFNGEKGQRLEEWLYIINTAFDRLRITEEQFKLQMATTFLSDGPLKVLMCYTKNEKNPTWIAFQDLLKTQYEPRNRELRARTRLRHLSQTGSFEEYLRRFRDLTIQLSEITEKEQLVAFTDGLNNEYKYEVLSKNCDTLEQAVEVCSNLDFCKTARNMENVIELNSAKFNGGKKSNFQEDKKPLMKGTVPKIEKEPSVVDETEEQYNGSDAVQFRGRCFRCHRRGHMARECHLVEDESDSEDEHESQSANMARFLLECGETGLKYVEGTLNGIKVNMTIDSGASCSIISAKVAKENNFQIRDSDVKIKVATNEKVKVIGITESICIEIKEQKCTKEMYVIELDDDEMLLGLDYLIEMEAQFCPSKDMLILKGETVCIKSKRSGQNDHKTSEKDEKTHESIMNKTAEKGAKLPVNENKMIGSDMIVVDTLDNDKKVLENKTESDANDDNVGCIGGVRTALKRRLIKRICRTRAARIGPSGEAPRDMFVICSKCVETERASELKGFLKESGSNEPSPGRMNGGTQFSEGRLRQSKKELRIERDSSSEMEEF